ncbi:unnamed protein product, partial [Ectocarpus sp. 12 AP-2014]
MCAYRLGRPSNIVEAFHPLSTGELDELRRSHPFWDKNMEDSFEDADFDKESKHVIGKEGLGEGHEWAYRLIVERSNTFYSYLTPVIVNACGTRDPYRYEALALNSLDTNHVSHTRCYDDLLDEAMKGSPSLDIVKGVLRECEGIFQKARTGRDSRNADIYGALGGEGRKSRRDRVILEPDSDDRKFTLLMAFQMSMGEKVRPMIEKVEELSKELKYDFFLQAATCLKNARLDSGSFDKVVGEDHLLGRTSEDVEKGKAWIAGIVNGLDADGVSPQDWCRFSVVTKLGCLFNAACLRERSALNLAANTAYYNNERGRVAMRPPAKEKQHKTANKKLSTVLREHEIHGADVVRWVMVMNLVGRAFLRKHNKGKVHASFGPLNSNGTQISPDTFGKLFKDVMRAYFGVNNADVYSLRTSQDSQAVKDLLKAGANMDHPALLELAREQRTGGNNLIGAYCTYQFDRVAALVKDVVYLDFKGGLRRMSVEKRKRHDLPEFPDTQLWRIPDFEKKVRVMMAMTPPKVPEKVINDLGESDDDLPPTAPASSSMSIEPESGDGCALPPPSGGASYGGPSYTIDREEADAAKRLRMKKMKLEEEEVDEKRAAIRARQALSSVPAAVGGGASVSGAATAPVVADGLSDAAGVKSGASSGDHNPNPKIASNKVNEKDVRDALARHTRGQTEWGTPAGSIDVFTRDEVIEIKHFKNWKSGVGQVKAYGEHHPSHKKRLHLFAHEGEKALKYFKMATELCVKDGIRVTFEEVVSESNNLGVEVVDGADVFGISFVDATGLPTVTGDLSDARGRENGATPAATRYVATESTSVSAGVRSGSPSAAVGGGATAAAVTSHLSDTARVVTGPAADTGGSSESVSKASRRGVSYSKVRTWARLVPASEDECIGMQELARAVGGAWERAKKRGVEDKLYKKMNGRMKSARLNLVRCLIDEDDAFQPG